VVALPLLEMYLHTVDQATRNDIAAAAAAHHELGRDYDDAVAEGLVDRIGAEIDRRIDARVGTPGSSSRSPALSSRSARSHATWTGAGIGSGITGLVAIIANKGNSSPAVVGAVIAVWVILAIAALGASFVRRQHGKERG
jgi:hypothetical protein